MKLPFHCPYCNAPVTRKGQLCPECDKPTFSTYTLTLCLTLAVVLVIAAVAWPRVWSFIESLAR
jgi:predicted amidophosphoribosyltransferase